jgi:hypothetical protein
VFKISPCPVEKDVVPDSRSSRPAGGPTRRPLQLDDGGNRQPRLVSIGQQAGGDDRLLALGGSVVGDKEVPVGNLVTVPDDR